MLPRVFVARELPGPAIERLRGVADVDVWERRLPATSEELVGRASGADGLISLLTDRVDAAVLDACPRLRVVANYAVGFDNLDVAELTRRGIPASNTPGVLTEATADLTFALVLAVSRHVVEARDAVRAGRWATWEPEGFLGQELSGATIGIVGLGRIGKAVARRASGFSMRVLASCRSGSGPEGVQVVNFATLLAESDVVTLHCSLNAATYHLIGRPELEAMKPTAVLVNTARGPIVDQAALAWALRNGTIAAAGLDVVEEEPIPPDDPLLELPNCVVLPHIGSATMATRSKMADIAVANVVAGLAGDRLPNCVNPEVYEAGTAHR